MKKLTKKERHKVYKKALELLKEYDYVCHIINAIIYNGEYYYDLELYFPELFMFKDGFFGTFLSHSDFDTDDSSNHFEYNEKLLRRKQIVLDFCILMTK